MQLLIFFIFINIINVVLQTWRSLVTNKGGKWSAALVNALTYGVYTVLLVYMSCDLSLATKVAVTAAANLVGVFVVKLVEEKGRKDKLWKIEMTVLNCFGMAMSCDLRDAGIDFYTVTHGDWRMFYCFAPTQKESEKVKAIGKGYDAKFFVSETKNL